MAKKKRTKESEIVGSKPKQPVKGLIYSEGVVQMPFVMITTREAFENIWRTKFRSAKALDEAWNKAEKFKEKHS
jgi:ABC-type molybdate transport system permease subunit